MFRPPSLLSPQIVPTAAILLQGSRGFYVRAYRALLPPHAPDMLTVRIQVIDGTGTFTLSDSQPCRLLTLLRRHYPASTLLRPCPTPAMTVACRDVEPLPSPVTGLPRLPEPPFQRAVPTTPADRAGARVDCFPAHAAFPKWQEGRHPHCHFRGLLRLHSRYGPPDRSAAHARPLSRGSSPSGYPAEPLVSYQINRQLSGWNLPPLVIRAFGAHCQ